MDPIASVASDPKLNRPSTIQFVDIPRPTEAAGAHRPLGSRPGLIRSTSSESSAGARQARPASIQFVPQVGTDITTGRPAGRRGPRRINSPPPPTQFTSRVSFDTFDNRDASDYSLTLIKKHKDYSYSKRSRTFLCGTDANEYSDTALEWLVDELVEDGDEVVCLRVVDKDSREAREWSAVGSGKAYLTAAQNMLERIQEKNSDDRAINLVLEFAIGKVHDTIQHMIRIYEPALLVVGTRGRSLSGFQGLLPGSVSKYCLQHSPVPVIVVRPSSKRDKKKRKRLRDPARRGYRDILDKSEDVAEGGHLLDHKNRKSVLATDLLNELEKLDAEEEARKVAEAIGYNPGQVDGKTVLSIRHTRTNSMGTVSSEATTDPSRSPLIKSTKSPELRDLESPCGSDIDDESDSDYEPVPAYLLAQEQSLARARERALKAEEEERAAEVERLQKENNKPIVGTNVKKKRKKQTAENYTGGGAQVLSLLDDLRALEKQKQHK